MPRQSKKAASNLILVIVGVVIAIGAGLVALLNLLIDTSLIWFVPILIIGVVVLIGYAILQGEEKRVANIWDLEDKLGKDMCQWLIDERIKSTDARIARILSKYDEWGEENCKSLINQEVAIGMTDEMVKSSLGKPTTIDNQEITEKWKKFRWIYGIPRRGAAYIWFKDGIVTKIKQ